MASPIPLHQRVVIYLILLLETHLKEQRSGTLFCAPLDVEFNNGNVYQPDVFIVLRERQSIITNKKIVGAPDLVIEVLSTNKKYDLGEKMEVYGKYGVREYWTIDIDQKCVTIFHNQNGKMIANKKPATVGEVYSQLLAGFSLDVMSLFKAS